MRREVDRKIENMKRGTPSEYQCEEILSIMRSNGAGYIDGYLNAREALPYLNMSGVEVECLIEAMRENISKVRSYCQGLPEFVQDKSDAEKRMEENAAPAALAVFEAAGGIGLSGIGLLAAPFVYAAGKFGPSAAKSVAQDNTRRATREEIEQHTDRLRNMFEHDAKQVFKRRYENEIRREIEEQIEPMKVVLRLYSPIREHKIRTVSLILREENFAAAFRRYRSKFDAYLWGSTPLIHALESTAAIFFRKNDVNKKLLIISDGNPNTPDGGCHDECRNLIRQMECSGAHISSIFITNTQKQITDARRFYSEPEKTWSDGAKFMFEISSMVDNNRMPRSLVSSRGWKLPTTGQCKLFIQVNHPEVLDEASDMFTKARVRVDSIINVIGQIDLDIVLAGDVEDFEKSYKRPQVGKTCYAHAVATVLYLATARIMGYHASQELMNYFKAHLYSDKFSKLEQEINQKKFHSVKDIFLYIKEAIIDEFGIEGENTEKVLERICPMFRLRFRSVTEDEAKEALNALHPLVTTFSVAKNQWNFFWSGVFWSKKEGTEKKVLCANDMPESNGEEAKLGHAVVLVDYEKDHMRFLNSRGLSWGDGGFFRVDTIHSLKPQYSEYFDVYFEEEDLTESEKKAWPDNAAEIVEDVNHLFPYSSKTLKYECPEFKKWSLIGEYGGTFVEAKCPECHNSFQPGAENVDILKALYSRD